MDMKRSIWRSIALMAVTGTLVFAPAAVIHAQGDITGAVAVIVADEEGQPLPGVALSLRSDAINLNGLTDAAGSYRFGLVPADIYVLRADLSGFAPAGLDNINVSFGSTYTAELVLRGEEFAGEVTVTAAPPQIDTTIPTTRDSLSSQFIQEIPLRNRNFEEIVNLLPGVADNMVQGSRSTSTGYRIDGASNVDPYNSGVAITFSQSAIDRFELVPNGFEARYGEFSGGVVNVTTRSGSNEFVGHLGYFYRDDSFVSKPPGEYPGQVHDKAPDTRHFMEAAIGGKITEDKLHYFATLEYRRSEVGGIYAETTVDTDTILGSFKLNWLQNNSNQWTFFAAVNSDDISNIVLADQFIAPEFNADETDDRFMLSVQQSHVFSDSLFLESQFSYLGSSQDRLRVNPDAHVTLYTFTPVGTFTSGKYTSDSFRDVDRLRLQETLTWYLDRHNLRFGADIGHLSSTFDQLIGETRFDFRQTGWDAAFHYQFFDVFYSDSGIEGALYAQDSWRLSNQVVLDFGGRVEYQEIIGNTDFSPRLGIAWDVTGDAKTKIYANAGRFIERVYDRYLEWGAQPGGEYSIVFSPEGDLADGDGFPVGSFGYRILGDNPTPYADVWSLGVERLLGKDYRVGASYTDKKLENQLLTYYTAEGAADWYEFEANGKGSYKGLDLTFSKAFSKNWQALASYTWSESKGMGSFLGTFYGPTQIPPESSLEDSDRTHMFKVSGTWSLPLGFLVSGSYRYQSGRPYSIEGNNVDNEPIYIGGRNSQRMPDQQSLDMTFQWGVEIAGTRLTLVLEGFNLTNHENVTAVSTGEVGHGTPTAFDVARTFQLGAKFDF
jgi:hypothetical protein